MWIITEKLRSDGVIVGYTFEDENGEILQLGKYDAAKLVGKGNVANAKLQQTNKNKIIVSENYKKKIEINSKNQITFRQYDSLEGVKTPAEVAGMYLQKYSLVQKKPPLDITITQNGDVVLDGVNNHTLDGEIEIPWFITQISWDAIHSCLEGCRFRKVTVNNSKQHILDIKGLCSRMQSTEITLSIKNPKNIGKVERLFYKSRDVKSIEINNLQSTYTNAESMFAYCTNLRQLKFAGDTKLIVDKASGLFLGCKNLTSIDNIVDRVDFSGLEIAVEMFSGCEKLKHFNFNKIKLQNLVRATSMFGECKSLVIDSKLKLRLDSLLDAKEMFLGCNKIQKFDFNSIQMPKVRNIQQMLQGCSQLRTVSFEGTEFNSLVHASSLCADCTQLKQVKFKDQKFPNLRYFNSAFEQCTNLEELDFDNSYLPQLAHITGLVMQCSNIVYVDMMNTQAESLYTIGSAFKNCGKLKVVRLPKCAQQIDVIVEAFRGDEQLSIIIAPGIDINKTYNKKAFEGCRNLKNLCIASKSIDKDTIKEQMLDI